MDVTNLSSFCLCFDLKINSNQMQVKKKKEDKSLVVVVLFCYNSSRGKNAHMPLIIQSPMHLGPADGQQDGTMQADDALYPELHMTGMGLQKHVTQSKNT